MKIYFNNTQNDGFNSTEIIKCLDYTIDLTMTHNASGEFLYENLVDKCLGVKYGYSHKNGKGYALSSRFYQCIDIMKQLKVLDVVENHSNSTARRYCINKEIFFLTYCALCAINSLTKKQIIRTFGKGSHLTLSTILDITTGIYSSISHGYFYINPKYSNLIYRTYSYCYMFSNNDYLSKTLNPDGLIPLVKYFGSLDEELLNRIIPAFDRASTFNKLRTKQYHNNEPVYITKEWFTNEYRGPVKTLNELDSLYYGKIRTNPLFRPLINKLDTLGKNIDLQDVVIDRDLLNKLPGSTIDTKQALMERIVRYHSISEYPLLRYAMEIADAIAGDEDQFHMKVNIKTRKHGNKYGTNTYLVHPSSRLYNKICSYKKAKHCERYEDSREYFMSREGMNGYFDITGTIFTIARSLNLGISLDLSYDIKQKIADMEITGKLNDTRITLKRDNLKLMMFYMFFLDEDTAYKCYKNRFNSKYYELESLYGYDPAFLQAKYGMVKEEMLKTIPSISEYDFRRIYRYVQESTGGTLKYKNNIFVIESAIEALVVQFFNKKGIKIHTVFDAFFFDEEQITKAYLKDRIIECADKVFAKYYELSNSVPFIPITAATCFQPSL